MIVTLIYKDTINSITLPEKVTEALKITEDIFGKCTEEEFNQLNN